MSAPWSLPGPDSFIGAVAKNLRKGTSVVLRFAEHPPFGLEEEIKGRCDWGDEWTPLRAGVDAERRGVLGSSVADQGPPVPAHHLLNRTGFYDRIIWVEGIDPVTWLYWRDLLVRYSDACRNLTDGPPPSVFVVPLCGAGFERSVLSDVWIRYLEYRNVVHRDDLFMLALKNILVAPEYRFLLAATVAHVAQWDLRLAERLIGARPESILQPWKILEVDAAERGWTEQTPEIWEAGTVDGPTSRPLVHSSLLCVKGRLAELNRRLWAAQVSALLPLVADRQAELVREFGADFELPLVLSKDNGKPTSISSLDNVELRHVVRYRQELRAPAAAVGRALPLHRLRNRLAHYELLDLTTDEWRNWKLLSGRS